MKRRQFVQTLSAASALGTAGLLSGCASGPAGAGAAHVVVVGGGYGGATAAKHIRMFSEGRVRVTLIEPNPQFISCPISNLVIGGQRNMDFITHSYDSLQNRHGVRMVRDSVTAIDAVRRTVRLAGGSEIGYDRLIVSPGIDFMWQGLPGMASPEARARMLHAWKAGEQTVALRRQLEAMPDGGVYAINIPAVPYRCPPGPYERACLVANYFKKAKPRSKVIIFDANPEIQSKRGLFSRVFEQDFKGTLEYRPGHVLTDVHAPTNAMRFEVQDEFRPAVANVLPSMRAGDLALRAGLANVNNRWCEVNFQTFESVVAPNIHVLGDAIQGSPGMPKSGHMANQHGKVCAMAVVSLLQGQPVPQLPIIANTCYSFVNDTDAIHVSSVHRWDAERRTLLTVPGSGGVSVAPNEMEGRYAIGWALNIWADTLG
ncbi:NAD(P)/FAD-dependent oxidoreductase [Serpentinimonas barnesii]|uniref:NAD(P)/FAD-dependent oxidoreductase n=1 Tax=Serpentinimonas barnesii TaxID=1458427 RepID=UPI0004984A95|nr:NAD(P)/FAD-dependent oxidoreductase [Serpentinimonas barnesii]